MIHAHRLRVITAFELRSSMFRLSYVLVTFGMPLLLAGIGGLAMLVNGLFMSAEETRKERYGIVDTSGLLPTLGGAPTFEGPTELRLFRDADAAQAALLARRLEAYYVIERDYLATGRVSCISRGDRWPLAVGQATANRLLTEILRHRLVEGRLPREVASRLRDPLVLELVTLEPSGARASDPSGLGLGARMLVPVLFALLLSMSLISGTAQLAQALAVEKQNKVVEILLSSATPDEILAGKLLALTAASLFQVGVWTLMVGGTTTTILADLLPSTPLFRWEALAAAPMLLVLGYLFMGSLMLATAALSTNAPESQKLGVVWSMLSVLPLMLLFVLTQSPHGVTARLLTWFPFTAPVTIAFRLSMDAAGVPIWELVGSVALLMLATWASLRVGARLFRVGLLLTGRRPAWSEIVRQARLLR